MRLPPGPQVFIDNDEPRALLEWGTFPREDEHGSLVDLGSKILPLRYRIKVRGLIETASELTFRMVFEGNEATGRGRVCDHYRTMDGGVTVIEGRLDA